MRRLNEKINQMLIAVYVRGIRVKESVFETLKQNTAEGFVDTALKILISVVVGALLLAGLYTLFKDTILPTLQSKIQNLFNYNG